MSLPSFLEVFDDYGTFQIYDVTTGGGDGYGGNIKPTYTPGGMFKGVLVLNNSVNAQIAQKQGVTGVYTLSFGKELRLAWHTVFQKVILDKDGKVIQRGSVYRVTTKDDNSAPNTASTAMQFRQVTAEEWKIPTELEVIQGGNNNG